MAGGGRIFATTQHTFSVYTYIYTELTTPSNKPYILYLIYSLAEINSQAGLSYENPPLHPHKKTSPC